MAPNPHGAALALHRFGFGPRPGSIAEGRLGTVGFGPSFRVW
jgi:hypothetical protein